MSSFDERVVQMLANNHQKLEDFVAQEMAIDLLAKLRDVDYVWPTPELHAFAEEWREAELYEHNMLYGDGSAEPKGILYAKGVKR